MPSLRATLLSTTETLSALALAADMRYRDGEQLLNCSRFSGAVYVLGLAAEMYLKYAALRVAGHGPATPNQAPLGGVVRWMRANFPAINPESKHSLEFWATFIRELRRSERRELPLILAGQLKHHVTGRLYEDWKIDIRYSVVPVSERHAWRVFADTSAVRTMFDPLWR